MRRKLYIRDALVELLKVRTLITLAVVGACIWGFIARYISTEVFVPVVTMVLTHYFRKGKDE
jgi:hypothetical protein